MKVFNTIAVLAGLSIATTAQAGLVGHWGFDEGSNGTLATTADLSGNGHTATGFGGASYTVGRIGNGALSLDGSAAYVQVIGSAGSALDIAGSQYTVAWWARANATSSGIQAMIGNDDGADYANGVLLYYINDGSLWASQIKAGGTSNADTQTVATGYDVTNPPISIADGSQVGEWVHFAMTFDESTGFRNFYVNGIHFGAYATADKAGAGSTDVFFGRYTVNNLGYFNGDLDDIRIYDNALSQVEIQELLTAVPEPSSMALLGFGALSLLHRRRS